jgi:ABC-2 type transport system ATP-binding protein
MSTILRKLQREVFVLSLADKLDSAPDLPGFESSLIDDCALEVAVDSGADLNTLFGLLDERGIRVLSLRNKANRLEEMFMELVDKKQVAGNQGG